MEKQVKQESTFHDLIPDTMKLTYIYHSGFALEWEDFAILIDYYKDTTEKPGEGFVHSYLLKRPGKLYILSTHSHPDHFNPEILGWQKEKSDIQYILSKDIISIHPEIPSGTVVLDKPESWQDAHIKIKAFGSTDIGISFLIETEGKRIFHAGDLNNWHWEEESTPKEVQEYETNFLNEVALLTRETTSLDIVMFPIDPRLGKDYMRGARQFIDRININWFIPMHFQEQYNKAAAFRHYAESKGCKFVKWTKPGESIKII